MKLQWNENIYESYRKGHQEYDKRLGRNYYLAYLLEIEARNDRLIVLMAKPTMDNQWNWYTYLVPITLLLSNDKNKMCCTIWTFQHIPKMFHQSNTKRSKPK